MICARICWRGEGGRALLLPAASYLGEEVNVADGHPLQDLALEVGCDQRLELAALVEEGLAGELEDLDLADGDHVGLAQMLALALLEARLAEDGALQGSSSGSHRVGGWRWVGRQG